MSMQSSCGSNDVPVFTVYSPTRSALMAEAEERGLDTETFMRYDRLFYKIPASDPVCDLREQMKPAHLSEITVGFCNMTDPEKKSYVFTRAAYIEDVIKKVIKYHNHTINTINQYTGAGIPEPRTIFINELGFTFLTTRTIFAMFEILYGPVPPNLIFNTDLVSNLVHQVLLPLMPPQEEMRFYVNITNKFDYEVYGFTKQLMTLPLYPEPVRLFLSYDNAVAVAKCMLNCLDAVTPLALYAPKILDTDIQSYMTGFSEGSGFRGNELNILNTTVNDLQSEVAGLRECNEELKRSLAEATSINNAMMS